MPQSQAFREPSRMGSPTSAYVAAPSAVSQFWASASVTCGIVPMSAYSACPHLSAAIVFTHGIPWYRLRIRSTSPTVRA